MSEHSFKSGDQLGHYRLTEKIGSGGQGEVWLARDERFDRNVALKILPSRALADPGARERFRREARAVGKLNHPNIATAHDFDTTPVDYLVTEYVSGSGLDQRLAGGALPEETVIGLGIQLGSGLEAAHREGIIHRDLKPGNIRITHEGTLKILDFGLAEMVDPTKDFASMETITINMTLTGTLPYMAPEQFGGVADQRTDLWSVGAVLYEMATGKLPFTETQIQQLRDAIQRKEPALPRVLNPSVSAGLERVILRCLKKSPGQRYQSATELREDLVRLSEGRKTKDAEKLQGKRFALAALAIVLIVSAAAGISYWPQIRQKLWPSTTDSSSQFRLMAILPIQTKGQGSSDDALVRGMADTVSARIAQGTNGQKLQLIPPSELIARDALTTDAARREFGVERVLEVTLQRSGDKVRVTCSLIDTKTHQVLNACTVDGDGADLFALQDTLAGEVIAMLPQGSRNEQGEPEVVHATPPAGYEFYLKGRGYLLDYQKAENIDSAIKEFEQALNVNPNYGPAYAGLGDAYWHGYKADRGKDWLDKAKVDCEKSLTIDSNLPEGHVCLGDIYNDTGKYKDAVEEFRLAAASVPKGVDALNGLAEAYDKLGNASAAEETYKKAVALQPQYWAVYNWAGAFYAEQARYADAVPMFQKVIELTPDNQRGYNNLCGTRLALGLYDEAIATCKKATELAPSRDSYGNLGATYFYLRQYAKAVDEFELAVKQDENDAATWGYLGDALYWAPGRRHDALRAYEKGTVLAKAKLSVNPNDAMHYALLAEFSAMLDQKQEALSAIQKALALAPKNPDILFKAALVYNRFGDRAQTLSWLKKATEAGYPRLIVKDTPDFDSLRDDNGYRSIVAQS